MIRSYRFEQQLSEVWLEPYVGGDIRLMGVHSLGFGAGIQWFTRSKETAGKIYRHTTAQMGFTIFLPNFLGIFQLWDPIIESWVNFYPDLPWNIQNLYSLELHLCCRIPCLCGWPGRGEAPHCQVCCCMGRRGWCTDVMPMVKRVVMYKVVTFIGLFITMARGHRKEIVPRVIAAALYNQ